MQAIDLRILDGRDVSNIFNFGLNLKEKNLEGQINAHNVFSSLIEKIKESKYTKDQYLTGIIKQEIWNLENKFGWNSRYYSQAGQDKIIFETFFKNLKMTDKKNNEDLRPSKMRGVAFPKAKYGVILAIIIIILVNLTYYKDKISNFFSI